MAVELKTIGEFEGLPVVEAVLTSEAGALVSVISYGASVRHWQVYVQDQWRSVVLGYPDFDPYKKDPSYLGAIIGRVANRISGASFSLDGRVYHLEAEGKNYQLHGGPGGIGRRNWNLQKEGDHAISLSINSPAFEMGFPGEVEFKVVYRLEGHRLHIDMSAWVTEQTPISMVQHSYFNLMGDGDVRDHRLMIDAPAYTVLNGSLVATGEILRVAGTRFDFQQSRPLRGHGDGDDSYDINFVFARGRDVSQAAVEVMAPDGSLTLRLWTDQPGLQLYNAIHLNHRAICLEDQALPNAVNRPEFPSILVSPDQPYRHHCEIEIKP